MTYYVPLTDADDFDFEVEEEAGYLFIKLGSTILNNAGS